MKILITNAKNTHRLNLSLELLKQNLSKIIIYLKYIVYDVTGIGNELFSLKERSNLFTGRRPSVRVRSIYEIELK